MRKQFVLCLCILSVASCGGLNHKAGSYTTLADMFVWGDADKKVENTQRNVKVSYKERLPLETSKENLASVGHYQYNDDVKVEYITQETSPENNETIRNKDITVKEVIIETSNPDKDTQTYTLTKRSDRYKDVEETFSPNVYAILASRVANKVLADIPAIFAEAENPALYIEETVYGDRQLPATPDVTTTTIKEIIANADIIPVVDDINFATHILKGRIGNMNTPETPIFKYGVSLHDENNVMIDKWSDTIRQVQNDDGSWW